MSSVPIHPAIVHLPLALALLVPIVALGAAVAVHRGKLPRWVWAVVLGLQAALVGSGALAMQTGERDEDRVEAIVGDSAMEAHEETAEHFVYAAAGLTVLFALGLVLPRAAWRSGAMGLAVIGSAALAALAIGVGHSGGELVYVHGAAAAHAAPAAHSRAGFEAEDED